MDWCTFWPDSLFGISWAHCCAVHDIAYTLNFDKLEADLALRTCVARQGLLEFLNNPDLIQKLAQAVAPIFTEAMGAVMLVGVAVFGGFVKLINSLRVKHGKKTI
jgi:hypothetical protein